MRVRDINIPKKSKRLLERNSNAPSATLTSPVKETATGTDQATSSSMPISGAFITLKTENGRLAGAIARQAALKG